MPEIKFIKSWFLKWYVPEYVLTEEYQQHDAWKHRSQMENEKALKPTNSAFSQGTKKFPVLFDLSLKQLL